MIANPLRGGGIASLFSTHPPMEERVRAAGADGRDHRHRSGAVPAADRSPGGWVSATARRIFRMCSQRPPPLGSRGAFARYTTAMEVGPVTALRQYLGVWQMPGGRVLLSSASSPGSASA